FDLLVAQPELLNRPIVEQDDSAFLCRPLEVIKEKMPAYDWSEYF
ncbi:arsenate reductase family protein, partial [Streptococcus pyogenes]